MPPSFRALRAPHRPLREGDTLVVKIAPGVLPVVAVLRVVSIEIDRAVVWRGGVRGVLVGEHTFRFEDEGDGTTRLRSDETWSGALTALDPFARSLRASAERVGASQLEGLARFVEAEGRGR